MLSVRWIEENLSVPGPLAKKKWCPEPAGICSGLSPFLSHMILRQETVPSPRQWGRAKGEVMGQAQDPSPELACLAEAQLQPGRGG